MITIIIPYVIIKNSAILALYVSRFKTKATEMYKCENDINPAYIAICLLVMNPTFSEKWWKIWTNYC